MFGVVVVVAGWVLVGGSLFCEGRDPNTRTNPTEYNTHMYNTHTQMYISYLVASVEGAGLAGHGLDEHPDRHARREGVLVCCL